MQTWHAQIRCEHERPLGHCGMKGFRDLDHSFSRRVFLEKMRWAPFLFLPAPLRGAPFKSVGAGSSAEHDAFAPIADFRLTPHYPAKSPLEEVLRLVTPGSDEFITEKYAFEIGRLLNEWSRGLQSAPPAAGILAQFVDPAIEATSFVPVSERSRRSGNGIVVLLRQFSPAAAAGRDRFLQEMQGYLAPLLRVETAEFEIVGIRGRAGSSTAVDVEIRYDLVGIWSDGGREERIGHWLTQWKRSEEHTSELQSH